MLGVHNLTRAKSFTSHPLSHSPNSPPSCNHNYQSLPEYSRTSQDIFKYFCMYVFFFCKVEHILHCSVPWLGNRIFFKKKKKRRPAHRGQLISIFFNK